MKEKTKKIKSHMGIYQNYKHRMNLLKNAFDGETCYILSCGPSLNDLDHSFIKDRLEDELVLTVKQAYLVFHEITDFHFFNCNNFSSFKNSPDTIYCSQADALPEQIAQHHIWKGQTYDLNFVLRDNKNHDNKLTKKKNFDHWTFDSRLDRPWGPSIMHETVLYMAMFLGVSEIRTIGWDHIDPEGENNKITHFYNNDAKISSKAFDVDLQEIKDCIELSKLKSQWLRERGITLKVMDSKKCYIHEDVERFSFQ